MKETIQNLLKVKSIVTIVLTGVFSYLAITHVISGEQFLTIFSVIIAFYFGTQYQKNEDSSETETAVQDEDTVSDSEYTL